MPFELKNVGATYQRSMNIVFHGMMHKNMKDYVDDNLAKSEQQKTHLANLSLILDDIE